MKKAKLLSVVALLALSACEVPTLQQRQVLDGMVGKSEVDVVRQFGVPSRSYQTEGHSFLAYIENETQYSGGGGWGWGGGWGGPGWGGWGGGWGGPGGWGGGWGGGFPSTYYNTTCQTTFELVTGHVVGWTMRGDGC
ncbi:hypothetical protein Gbth_005_008 [Gluconobacter thailandicus F149-1 = NBRC 100600]|uniref:hypothetical protein n=3 Tax=Gluconobacter thailandicus TaxID=257438 RepID=UPI0005E0FE05|nr:hypothetical protein [Gluconobacter thailandicus]GAN92007.1 hypothetical protein Gbth_005_008 [Gluconobacter thailandicus F149-1 = NBRC 100600]GEL86086.1 hypothetical protein GTH01_04440 [Gluconobacter thailandicus F149-1 = NBRC 100600]